MKPGSIAQLTFAVALLLLPLLYVASYLALVLPGPLIISSPVPSGYMPILEARPKYRVAPSIAEDFFWPLEQIDRRVRPKVWNPDQVIAYG